MLEKLVMKRMFKQWWSTIPPISTKRTITSHLKPLNAKRPGHMAFEIWVLDWNRHTNLEALNQ